MMIRRTALQGLWLPLVTPFRNGQIDGASLRRLVSHYASGPVDGFILGATTGEGMTLDIGELERIAALTRAEVRAGDLRLHRSLTIKHMQRYGWQNCPRNLPLAYVILPSVVPKS